MKSTKLSKWLSKAISNTKKASLKEPLMKFWSIKDNLSIDDDLIEYGCCLVFIPHSCRATMLSWLHEAHQLGHLSVSSKLEPVLPSIGPGSMETLKTLWKAAATAKTTCHLMCKNLLSQKYHLIDPSNRLQLALHHTEANGFSSLLTVKLDRQTSSKTEMIQLLKSSFMCSRDQLCRTAVLDILWSDRGP